MTVTIPLAEISKFYALDLTLVGVASGGFLSNNYILTDGTKKYFLKKHRNKEQAESVCRVEHFFADGGVSAILPIHTEEEKYLFSYQSSFYSLYPFVSGRHIERGRLTERAAVSLGSTLAILHKRGKESTLQAAEQFQPWNTGEFLSDAAMIEKKLKEEPLSEFGATVLESVSLKKRVITGGVVRYEQLGLSNDHLIHGDYFCDNVFFGDDDQVSYVFDFERTQYAPPMYELFRSMFVTFLSIPNQDNLSLARDYINAYLAIYPFPKEVVRNSLMAAFQKQMHSLWIEGGHYLNNSTRADSLLVSQYACNRYYVENHAEIEAYLLG